MANELIGELKVSTESNEEFNFVDAMKFLKDTAVYVGIPQENSSRPDQYITNAELLYIHTYGSPINKIPKRPVIEPALENDKDRVNEYLGKAAFYAFNGDYDNSLKQYKLLGMRAQNVSRAWFVNEDNGWPPNKPATIRRKLAKGASPVYPLIDTGELRKSITYFVDVKGRR